jgi:hypothetical protein
MGAANRPQQVALRNRFGDLVPFLVAWVVPIKKSTVSGVLRAVCGFLSIFLVLEVLGDRERIVERFAIAMILLTTCTLTPLPSLGLAPATVTQAANHCRTFFGGDFSSSAGSTSRAAANLLTILRLA